MTTPITVARNLPTQKKQRIADLLSQIIETLDLTKTQYANIESAYNGVGNYLSDGDDPLLKEAVIYPQGSVRLNTTVKPKNEEEYDIDLICYLPHATETDYTGVITAIRQRLESHNTYKELLSDLPRGFRINYAGDYHLDITPGRDYQHYNERLGQPLWVVDDKTDWKESNPHGYAEWFDESASKQPLRIALLTDTASRVGTEALLPLPDHTDKKLLNRIVQILKRHRDEWAFELDEDTQRCKPISVILTTLACHAYNQIIAERRAYDNDLDVLLDVLELMPDFIDGSQGEVHVRNPHMPEENFAEKWNRRENGEGQKRRDAFQQWHRAALATFNTLAESIGEDNLFLNLEKDFGKTPVDTVRGRLLNEVKQSREQGALHVDKKTGGLLVAGATASATATAGMPKNTFYGTEATSQPVPKNTFYGA
ncbi:nucleotidyltransferase [Serratia proteamaculans]|uniref:Nucleotidyltransferase n=1 Tax=Serratia proteamaculans TaxID=28151 RepID=A0ABS0TX48_SERPR|nr:nucleotidyltransferase [Serratia proteamaculans]MBI6182948.1 nucleotidyltransferase [Serratia proteamaculans]